MDLTNLINSLLLKELIVNSFSPPKFIKFKTDPLLIKFLNGALFNNQKEKYNMNDVFTGKAMRTFDKYHKSKNNTYKNTSNTFATHNKLNRKLFNHNLTQSLSKNNTTDNKKFSIVNKEPSVITLPESKLAKNRVNCNAPRVFQSYLDKLHQITAELQQGIFSKDHNSSGPEAIPNYKNSNKVVFNDYKQSCHKTPRFNQSPRETISEATAMDNHVVDNLTAKVKAVNLQNFNKFPYTTMNTIGTTTPMKPMVPSTTQSRHLNQLGVDNFNKLNEFAPLYKDIASKQVNVNNTLLSDIYGKLEVLVNRLNSCVDDLTAQRNSNSVNNVVIQTLQNGFKDLGQQLLEIKSLSDLNGIDIDDLTELLAGIDLQELNKLIKEINRNIHTLINKQEQLEGREHLVTNELKTLGHCIQESNDQHMNELNRRLLNIEHKQSEYSLQHEERNKTLVTEIQNVTTLLQNQIAPTAKLEQSLTAIYDKQESLFQEALDIKNYIIASRNQPTSTEDNKPDPGISSLIEEIKTNQNVVKEQSIFNEKIHKDMEIIKKSIVRLINEQARENKLNTITNKSTNNSTGVASNTNNQSPNNSQGGAGKSEGQSEQMSNPATTQKPQSNTNSNTREAHKNAQVERAIGKLREALDLDSIHTVKELQTEYIDEIIDAKINKHNTATQPSITGDNQEQTSSGSKEDTAKAANKSQGQNQNPNNTFILDNSKFFK